MYHALAKLFGKSPFAPLQAHMDKVAECVRLIPAIFEALEKGQHEQLSKLFQQVSALEHEADIAKNNIRNNLPKSWILPIERVDLLEILTLQDAIADQAEDIGVLVTLRKMTLKALYKADFKAFLEKNIECFESANHIVHELSGLLETSFGGIEAEKVKRLVDEVSHREHEADVIQRRLLSHIFTDGESMSHVEFYLWNHIFEAVGEIANCSERLSNRIRMVLKVD